MTWVVGGATPYGQAFVIGDTRVTFSDGREADLVRKVYWIGKDLCAGFSGSVRIGFDLMTDLSRKLQPVAGQEGTWKPEAVARRWRGEAASLFANYDERERLAKCSILIAAVTPRNNGPFAETVLIELRSPHFEPRFVGRYGAIQIGSGRDHEVYRAWVEQYFNDRRFVANFGSWGTGIAAVLASSLSERVQQNPRPGVAPTCISLRVAEGSSRKRAYLSHIHGKTLPTLFQRSQPATNDPQSWPKTWATLQLARRPSASPQTSSRSPRSRRPAAPPPACG